MPERGDELPLAPRREVDSMARYAALIGDISSSREIPAEDRRSIQRKLRETLDDLSHELGDALEISLQITGGDAFQGLFRDPPAIVDVYMGVWQRLPDVMFVYGIGAGGLTTDLSDRITEVDGPCFHRAKAALGRAQKEGKQVEAEGVPAKRAISTAFHLLHRIRSSWTETQRRYALAARASTTHSAVAEQFEVSSPAVSQTLKRAEYALFREAEEAARELLSLSLEENLLEEVDSHEEG